MMPSKEISLLALALKVLMLSYFIVSAYEKDVTCDVKIITKSIKEFYSSSGMAGTLEYCNEVTESVGAIDQMMKSCSEDRRSDLKPFLYQVHVAVNTFCLMARCNIKRAKECIEAGKKEIEEVKDKHYTKKICSKLRDSLACTMNHTVSCRPDHYNSEVGNSIEDVRSAYRKHCASVQPRTCKKKEVGIVDSVTTFGLLLTSGYLSKKEICKVLPSALESFADVDLSDESDKTKEDFANALAWVKFVAKDYCEDMKCVCDVDKAKECEVDASVMLQKEEGEVNCDSVIEKIQCALEKTRGCEDNAEGLSELEASLTNMEMLKFVEKCPPPSKFPDDPEACTPKDEPPPECECDLDGAKGCADDAKTAMQATPDSDCELGIEKIECALKKIRGCVDETPGLSEFEGELTTLKTSVFDFLCSDSTFPPEPESCVAGECHMDPMKHCITSSLTVCSLDKKTIEKCLKKNFAVCNYSPYASMPSAFTLSRYRKVCKSDLPTSVSDLVSDDFKEHDLFKCLNEFYSTHITMDHMCMVADKTLSCLDDLDLNPVSKIVVNETIFHIKTLLKGVCEERNAIPASKVCPEAVVTTNCIAFLMPELSKFSLLHLTLKEKLCSGDRQIDNCFSSEYCDDDELKDYFSDIKKSLKTFHHIVCHDWPEQDSNPTCDLAVAEDCQVSFLEDLFSKDDEDMCRTYADLTECAKPKMTGCPDEILGSMHNFGTLFNGLKLHVCCEVRDCDPAAAVTCIMDVHHFSKMPTPDWTGICSSLESSNECVEGFVTQCDECERDTVNMIVDHLNERLVNTCKYPPEAKCEAYEAMRCVTKLKEFWSLEDNSDVWDDFVCLKVYESRKCVGDHLEHCDKDTSLTVKTKLEVLVQNMGSVSCEKEADLKSCIGVFENRVSSILNWDAVKDSKEKGSKDKDSKEDKDSKDKDSKEDKNSKDKNSKEDKNSKDKNSKEDKNSKDKNSKDKGSKDKDSKEDKDSKNNDKEPNKGKSSKPSSKEKDKSDFLGLRSLCEDARSAWQCIEYEMKRDGFMRNKKQVLLPTLTSLWEIAEMICKAVEELPSCYSCENELTKEECNKEKKTCDSEARKCQTVVQHGEDHSVMSMTKGCVEECKPGCDAKVCTYCCVGSNCNEPVNGPVDGGCHITQAAKCVFRLALSIVKSDDLDCRLLKTELSCIMTVKKQCAMSGQHVFAITDKLYHSTAVKVCLAQLAEPTCSLHSVMYLGMFINTPEARKKDVCKLTEQTISAVDHAKETKECDDLELMEKSMGLIRNQLRGYGCKVIEGLRAHCFEKEGECELDDAAKVITKLVVLTASIKESENDWDKICRSYVEMKMDFMKNIAKCSELKAAIGGGLLAQIEMKAIKYKLLEHCEDVINEASCDPKENEWKCSTMTVLAECYNNFDVITLKDDCRTASETVECIEKYTKDCPPIQRQLVSTLLLSKLSQSRLKEKCPNLDLGITFSSSLSNIGHCILNFGIAIGKVLGEPQETLKKMCSETFVDVEDCLLSADLEAEGGLLPVEKMYMRSMLETLEAIRSKANCDELNAGSDAPKLEVSDDCADGYDKAARCLAVQTVGLLSHSFMQAADFTLFCGSYVDIESCVTSSLESCSEKEKGSLTKFEEILIMKSWRTCGMKLKSKPSCTPDVVNSCLATLSGFMSAGNISEDDQCRVAEIIMECVTHHSHGCTDEQMTSVKDSITFVSVKYEQACPDALTPFLCPVEEPVTKTREQCAFITSCLGFLTDLDTSPDKLFELHLCGKLESVLSCFQKEYEGCPDDVVRRAASALSIGLHTALGDVDLPCSINVNLDSFKDTCSLKHRCSIKTAVDCIHDAVDDVLEKGESLQDRAHKASSCLWLNVADCNTVQLAIVRRIFTEAFGSSIAWTFEKEDSFDSFSKIVPYFRDQITEAFTEPKFSLFDICFAVKSIVAKLEDVFDEMGDEFNLEKKALEQNVYHVKHFLTTACIDVELIGEVLNFPDKEVARCNKDWMVKNYTSILIQAFFSPFLTLDDSAHVCGMIASIHKKLGDDSDYIAECSDATKAQIKLGSKLLSLVGGNSCKHPWICSVEHAKKCVAHLGEKIAAYGITVPRDEICRMLHKTDYCVESFTYQCDKDSLETFRHQYWMQRNVAMDICSNFADFLVPLCAVEESKYVSECAHEKAHSCLKDYYYVIMWPFYGKHSKCSEYVKGRQCLLKTSHGCANGKNEEDYIKMLDSLRKPKPDACDVSEVKITCTPGCNFEEARQCLVTLTKQIGPWRKGYSKRCSHISNARHCLIKTTRDCSSDNKELYHNKLQNMLSSLTGYDMDCPNIYKCAAEFEKVARLIFAKSEEDSSESKDDDSKEKKDSKDDSKDSKDKSKDSKDKSKDSKDSKDNSKDSKEGSKDSKDSKEGSKEKKSDVYLPELCVRAKASWSCVKSSMYLLPSHTRFVIGKTLEGVWKAIQHRCASTVRHSCYSCSGAESNEECNKEIKECGYREQMCENIVKRVDGKRRYFKGCIRPEVCKMMCPTGQECRYCCQGNLCNQEPDAQTRVDPEICKAGTAVLCALSLTSSVISFGGVKCSSAQENLDCMDKHSNGCLSDRYLALSSTAYHVLSFIAHKHCSVQVTKSDCGSRAILAMNAVLGNPFSALNNGVCSGTSQTATSVVQIEESNQCSSVELIPVQQSLSLIQQLVERSCVVSASGEIACEDKKAEVTMMFTLRGMGHCTKNLLKTAACISYLIQSLQGEKGAESCSKARNYKCLDYLKNCDIPESIDKMGDKLASFIKSTCEAVDPVCAVPVDSITLARQCVTDYNTQSPDHCSALSDAKDCVNSHISDSLSIQQISPVQSFNQLVSTYIGDCTGELTISIKQDVYTGFAVCLESYAKDVKQAVKDVSVEALCQAKADSEECVGEQNLPMLSKEFLKLPLGTFNANLAKSLGDKCDPPKERRRRRDVTTDLPTCDAGKAADCWESYQTAVTTFQTLALIDRQDNCRFMVDKQECISSALIGCKDSTVEFFDILSSAGKATFDQSCVPILYTEPSCNLPFAKAHCLTSLSLVASVSTVYQKQVCRMANYGFVCASKYIKTCDAETVTKEMESLRNHIGGIVGNDCPEVTGKLFCDGELEVKNACDLYSAEKCMDDINPSISNTIALGDKFCASLKSNISCVFNAIQGCLEPEIETMSKMMKEKKKSILDTSCEVDEASLDYSTGVCVAKPTCRLSSMFECVDDMFDGDKEPETCSSQISDTFKTCLDSRSENCFKLGKLIIGAMYSHSFAEAGSVKTCWLPEFGTYVEDSCLNAMFASLDVILTNDLDEAQGLVNLCMVFKNYAKCKKYNNFMSEFITKNCPKDVELPVGVPQVLAEGCLLKKAAFCLKRQLVSTVFRSYVTLDDKEDLCNKRQVTEHCVEQATLKCSDKRKSYLKKMITLSASLVEETGVCEDPAMCIEEETFGCLNNLGVSISSYEVDSDIKYLCRNYTRMEKCFNQFSPTCTGGKKERLGRTRTTLLEQMETGICDGFVDPEEPATICPDIEESERKCDMFAAFNCLLKFNTELLMSPSIVFLDKCIELQKVLRCVQSNVAGCKEKEAYTVLDSLSKMKTRAGLVGCRWLHTEACAKTETCPVIDAKCITKFQDKLINNPDRDICGLVSEAQACISKNTATCVDFYKKNAEHYLELAMKKLGVPVRCDSVNFDPCLESYKAYVSNLLSGYNTHTAEVRAAICANIVLKKSCIVTKMIGMKFADSYGSVISAVFAKVNDIVTKMCLPETGDLKCKLGEDIAKMLHFITWMTAAEDIDKSAYCSILPVLQKHLSDSTCKIIEPALDSMTSIYKQFCVVETACVDFTKVATICIVELKSLSKDICSKMVECENALAEVYGQCDKADADNIFESYKNALVPFTLTCQRFPQFKLLSSQKQTVYLSEGGLSGTLSLTLLEAPSVSNIPEEAALKTVVRITSEIVNNPKTVPKCANEKGISQVVLSNCETTLEETSNTPWSPLPVKIPVYARIDGRQDGEQEVTFNIVAEKLIEREGTMARAGQQIIASYKIVVVDRDVKNALCSSINDPHIKNFDGATFNNMKQGTFNLYTNKKFNTAVHVTYQQCAEAGTCNCRVLIRADNDVIDFNRCKTAANIDDKTPVLLTVNIHRKDTFTTGARIYNSKDKKTYHIVFRMGTIVKVKSGGRYLNVWIMPSVNDLDVTEGLCGNFDKNLYNDFVLPNGDRYMIKSSDRDAGALTPDGFSEAWRIVKDSEADMSHGVKSAGPDASLPTFCSCDEACSAMDLVATCGLVKAGSEDITASLVTKSIMDEAIGDRRRKRAVNTAANDPLVNEANVPQKAGWPTKDGFTQQSARALCELYIGNSTMAQKCGQAMEVSGSVQDLTKSIEYCMEDIRVAGGPEFLAETLDDLMEECLVRIEQDPTFQSNANAKSKAMEVKDLSCNPADCSGNGQCVQGSCECSMDYIGADCSMRKSTIAPPTITSLENSGMCEFQPSLDCSDIFVNGQSFVQSELLMCHIQLVEITQTGYKEIHQMILTPAILLTETQIKCSIHHVGKIKHAAIISVSNDARSPSNSKLFIAFDPVCHDCDTRSGTCLKITNTCEIANQCYAAGYSSQTDSCLFCQPSVQTNDWTYSQNEECEVRRQRTAAAQGIGRTVIVIIGIVTAVIALVILGIIVKIVLNMRSKKTGKRDSESPKVSTSAAYDNPTYRTRSAPQEYFVDNSFHMRSNTRENRSRPL